MSLFPAYADNEAGDEVTAKEVLPWQKNESCPPEVGQLLVSAKEERKTSDIVEPDETANSSNLDSSIPRQKEKNKKKKKKHKRSSSSSSFEADHDHRNTKKKKKKKKKKKYKRESSSDSPGFHSDSRNSRSPSQGKQGRSRSREGKHSLKRYEHESKARQKNDRHSRSPSQDRYTQPRGRKRSRDREKRLRENHQRSRSRERKYKYRRSRSSSREKRSPSRSKSRKKEKSPSRSQDLEKEALTRNKGVFLDDLHGLVKPENAFEISVKGDSHNMAFKTTHYSEMARYKVKGMLDCSSVKREPWAPKKTQRYYTASVLHATQVQKLPVCDIEEKEYIPIELSTEEEHKKRKAQQTQVNPLGIYDEKTEEYMQGKGGLTPDENITSQDIEYQYWQHQMKAYNERLGKESSNVDLWIEFVNFQDKAYVHLFHEDSENKKNEKKKKINQKALAERKISILDKAIKKNFNSTELQFQRLCVGQHIWDDKKLKQEWGTFLFNFPNKIHAWYQYLLFTQTHFTSFTLPMVVKTFAKCTERLHQMQNGNFLTHAAPSDIGKCMVDVALQLAHVWRQAGYMERSIALFQALIEFNLFTPDYLKDKSISLEARLAIFEPFWDSRAARFGEKKSAGWAQVMKEKQKVEYQEIILEGTHDAEDELLAEGGNTSKLWLALETSRERQHWLAWEDDPEECEDSERMVPYEELAPHLFILENPLDHFYLMLQFFRFLGVPNTKQFLPSTHAINPKKKNRLQRDEKCDVFEVLNYESLEDTQLLDCNLDSETDLMASEIFNFSDIGCGPSLKIVQCQDFYKFVCEAVLQASSLFAQPYKTTFIILYIRILGLRYLALRSKITDQKNLKEFAKVIRKQIKNIVKSEEFRYSLPVYKEYIKLEEIMEHYDDAENVYVLALSAGTTEGNLLDISHPNFITVINLYTDYVKLQLEKETRSGTLKYSNNVIFSLCSVINDEKFTVGKGDTVAGVSILKAKKKLVLMKNTHCLSIFSEAEEKNEEERILAIKITFLHGLMELLTSGLKHACLVFDSVIDKINGIQSIQTNSQVNVKEVSYQKPKEMSFQSQEIIKRSLELIYDDYLWVINISAKLKQLSKGEIAHTALKSLVVDAVKIAPDNTKFLLLLAENQSWRDLLYGTEIFPTKTPSILMLISQLLPHIQKTVAVIANTEEGSLSCVNRLENVLATAVNHLPGRNCPLLWRLYLAVVAKTEPKKLKSLVYSALFHCPGVKSVYLDCILHSSGLLKEIVNIMTEKGLRVRLPLEELQVLTEKELDLGDNKDQSSEESDNDDN